MKIMKDRELLGRVALTVLLLATTCLLLLGATGCGSAAYAEGAYAKSESPSGGGEYEAAPTQAVVSPQGAYDFDESTFGSRLDESKKGMTDTSAQPEEAYPGKGKPTTGDVEHPLVVYTGYLRLQVRRVLDAVNAITKKTEDRGGYIESMTSTVVVVRVPGQDFDQVMVEFAQLGEVLEQNIRAEDVTDQFTDVGARLVVAKDARARLLALLAQEKNVEQRLAILAEIKRLTEDIEAMESTLTTLQNLVDYFTITIELEPILEDSRSTLYESPFQWIRELSAHQATLDGDDDFVLSVPKGFVHFDEEDDFRAQSADTAMLRATRIDNEPVGDDTFWGAAVQHEMLARGEKAVKDGTSGAVRYRAYVSDDLKPRYYLVGVAVRGEELFVIEAFFPNQESYERHIETVIASLATFRPE